MEFDSNIESLRAAFWQIIIASGPILGVALAVGLVIGILQAATSINEMTLSFVPKLVIVLAAMAALSSFMMQEMTDYFASIFEQIRLLK
ncbi:MULTISPECIES: flagellar biosynthesis protein FliQ [Yoonia]|jgi:flagellar biosynthesis protein FliQ|uniref:Flagellar biosynthetic protein FliQ n=1 Tax=Yoonia vestfoldensis TaxID=245188 RepID=A0A1Y0EH59_9RHOB|nr:MULTISPECIES: flagellar biosynthesis protein FliQ [Yoonia]ARU02721.1 flagellar biosynthesis protein FliQ [Yoonia vestfoldensis]